MQADPLKRAIDELLSKIGSIEYLAHDVRREAEKRSGGEVRDLRDRLKAAVMCADPREARELALEAFVVFANDAVVTALVRGLPTRPDPRPGLVHSGRFSVAQESENGGGKP